MTKNQCINEIKRAFEHAKENGFKIAIASDPEANNWNEIDPTYMVYGDSNKNFIALGVISEIDASDIFSE